MKEYTKLKININNILYYIKKVNKSYYNITKYNLTFIKKHFKILAINLLNVKKVIVFTKFIILIKLKKLNIFFSISNNKGLSFYSLTKFSLKLTKKSKNNEILKKLIEIIFLKAIMFKHSPLILHFINLNIDLNWFVNLISKKLVVVNIKNFYKFSHNGCRKKKLNRVRKNG